MILRGLPYFNWSPTFRNMERVFIDSNSETLSVLKSEWTIYFWTDKCLQSGILRDNFSGPLCFVCCTGLFLADMGEHVKETWHWKLHWKRSFIKAIRTLTVNYSYNCSMRLVWVQIKRIAESPAINTVKSCTNILDRIEYFIKSIIAYFKKLIVACFLEAYSTWTSIKDTKNSSLSILYSFLLHPPPLINNVLAISSQQPHAYKPYL